MAQQISGTFSVIIRGQNQVYTIQAHGPHHVEVPPHAFTWTPPSQQSYVLDALQTGSSNLSMTELMSFGQTLHQAIFISPISMAFGVAQGKLKGGEGLRLRLEIEPPELAALPWELMHDGRDFVALRSDFPLVRSIGDTQSVRRMLVRGKLRILYVGASPIDMPALDIESPAKEMRVLLETRENRRRIQFDMLMDATLDSLRRAVLKDYHILCFAGHGDRNHIYLLNGYNNEAEPVSILTLARELEGKPIRVLLLAACETAMSAPQLAATTKMPALIAMRYPVGDWHANRFSARFFESLSSFRPVDVSMAEARKTIIQEGHTHSSVFSPALYLQSETSNLFQRAINRVALLFAAASLVALVFGVVALLRAGNESRLRIDA